MVEEVKSNECFFAIIVRNDFNNNGITFFTPNELSQQLAFMRHPKGKIIEPHIHNAVPRAVLYTQEVLLIKSGILRVDFYHDNHIYFESRYLNAGDVILLMNGGHGFEVIEEVSMFEVKQGPYAGDNDKIRFTV